MSQRLTLKDDHYRIIGYVEIDNNGKKTLKDSHFRILGYYDPKTDVTKDDHFRIIGHGDILTTLLNR